MARKMCLKSGERDCSLLLVRKLQHSSPLLLPQPPPRQYLHQDYHQFPHMVMAYLKSILTPFLPCMPPREVRLHQSLGHLTRMAMVARPAVGMHHTKPNMVVLRARTHLHPWCPHLLASSTRETLHQPAACRLLPIRMSLFQQRTEKIFPVGMMHLSSRIGNP
jgi:hypothetical protein